MEHIASLFGTYTPKKRTSERAELIRYFHERARDKSGKPYRPAYIAARLSHLTVQDLYAFKSMLADRERTVPGFNWNKAFFGMLKPR